MIAELQQQLAEANSTIGALRHDVIYKARVLLDEAMEELPSNPDLLDQAKALLAAEELGD